MKRFLKNDGGSVLVYTAFALPVVIGMLGFAINVITGMLFFLGADYTQNNAFYWKLIFIVLAGLNTLYFTFDRAWAMAPGDNAPVLSKLVAATALFFWVGVMFWGSMLPFIGNAF